MPVPPCWMLLCASNVQWVITSDWHSLVTGGALRAVMVCIRKWVDPYMLQDVSDFNRGDMDFQTLIARQQDWVALTPRNQWKEPAGKLVLSLAARCTDRLLEAR